MKISALVLALFLAISNLASAQNTHPNSLLPQPAEAVWQEGQLNLHSDFSISLVGKPDSRVEHAVERFLERLSKRTGLSFSDASAKNLTQAALLVECKAPGLPVQSLREDESYTLIVTPGHIDLSAPNPLGVLHGLETLLQLVEVKDKSAFFPCVTLHDKPRFAWRGLLIDACRHWMPMEVIQRNLDGMAEAKMNVLHWHLSENQGFRVESRKFPKLQEMGSEGDFYTQDQVREVLAYARDRGIRVVPEFDMPGHSTSWLVGYPELAAAAGPYQVDHKFGVLDGCMDPTKEEVYKFIDGFIGEMAALFPDEYFHIGGDEVNGKLWNENVEIQRFMAQHHLKANQDLQTYFNGRVLRLLTLHHKKMVGWDEILQPDLPKTIVVQSWRGPESLAEAAKKGYDGILSTGYYLDLIQPAYQHYAVDPLPQSPPGVGQASGVPGQGTKSQTGPGTLPQSPPGVGQASGLPAAGLTPAQQAHVLGGESCMWSELVSPETIDSRIWPRNLAVAERLWSSAAVTDVADFYRRMEVESTRLDDLGLTHNTGYYGMLGRLAGEGSMETLKVLADVLEPLKMYQRHRQRNYTTQMPLTRLVDAVRPESLAAFWFGRNVDEFLKGPSDGGGFKGLEEPLALWRDNHKKLAPVLERSDVLIEDMGQSEDLSALGQLGLEALQYIRSGRQAPTSWQAKAQTVLERAQEPHGSVELAPVWAVTKLALAAGQLDKKKAMAPADWVKSLDDQVEAAKPKAK